MLPDDEDVNCLSAGGVPLHEVSGGRHVGVDVFVEIILMRLLLTGHASVLGR